MRKTWSLEERIKGQNQRAKQSGARHDLTLEQWLETLEYFDNKCAYCANREYEFIEHYFPVNVAGTTVSNCVPACASCNALKDAQNHKLTLYQNERVLSFIESKGAKVLFHFHQYTVAQKQYVILYCEECGDTKHIPGLALEKAQDYINEFYSNTGYAYLA